MHTPYLKLFDESEHGRNRRQYDMRFNREYMYCYNARFVYQHNLQFQSSLVEGCRLPVHMKGTDDWRTLLEYVHLVLHTNFVDYSFGGNNQY